MAMNKECRDAFKKENEKEQEETRALILERLNMIDKSELVPAEKVYDRLEKKYEV